MIGENSDQGGERNQDVVPSAYLRSTPLGAKISVASLLTLSGLFVTVFIFILNSYREAQNRLDVNFQSYGQTNAQQHKEIWEEVISMKFFLCAHFPSWRKCK